jgi:hypothetical protein
LSAQVVDQTVRARDEKGSAASFLDLVHAEEKLHARDPAQRARGAVVKVPPLVRELPGETPNWEGDREHLSGVFGRTPGARAKQVIDGGRHGRTPDFLEPERPQERRDSRWIHRERGFRKLRHELTGCHKLVHASSQIIYDRRLDNAR